MDLAELARHLRQEHIFVLSEKEELQRLTEEVVRSSEQLGHVSWIARQQKNLLEHLICASSTGSPETCYYQLNALEQINFLQGYLHLSYHESKIGEFFRLLCDNPKLLAYCMTKCSSEVVTKFGSHVLNSLYGNAILPDDEQSLLFLLKHLIHMQVIPSSNPRQLLRKGSCAFSVLFKLYTESLFSAKLFLTAALHKPIMQLLMEDEWFYDIDPVRALHRFPAAEKNRRFGLQNSPLYSQKVNEYREQIITKLSVIAERFINSLRNCMYCFPPALAWIISELYHSVLKCGNVDAVEARSMCADLVLSLYICSAICDPELYGITSDAPLSYIARHNLMQVAQMLQVLSVSQLEEIDPKLRDLYGKFEKNCMAFLLDTILEKPAAETPPRTVTPSSEFARACILITHKDLLEFISIMKQVESLVDQDSTEKGELHRLVENLPTIPAAIQQSHSTASPAVRAVSQSALPVPSSPDTPMSRKKSAKGKEKKWSQAYNEQSSDVLVSVESNVSPPFVDDVLIISLGLTTEPPGMLSEQKILEQDSKQKKANKSNSLLPGEDYPISESDVQVHEKRTRFSLSHDQDSIATSDNLEGVSEGASSRSVASDIENENDADNLSDMMSANVSERGTPNISGRETPTSQPGSQLDGHEDRRTAPELPVLVRKTNREDVTEKFGKFDLRQELEYYAKSTVSDSWSTDVLASDSEPPEQNQLERLEEVAEEMVRQNLLAVKLQEVFEVSETASDAWSTDVLASDTSERPVDRLLELEQDDNVNSSTPTASLEPMHENDELPEQSDSLAIASASNEQNPSLFDTSWSSVNKVDTNNMVHQENFAIQLTNLDDSSSAAAKLRALNRNMLSGGRVTDQSENSPPVDRGKQKHVSDIIAEINGNTRDPYARSQRTSSSLQYANGKVATALELFDPLHTSNQNTNKRDANHVADLNNHCSVDQYNKNENDVLPTSSDHHIERISPLNESGIATDLLGNCDASNKNSFSESKSILRNSQQKSNSMRRVQGVIEGVELESSSSVNWVSDVSVESLDDSLRLLEQQNVKIDTKRFSSVTAMDFFDVLPDDNSRELRSPTDKRPPAADGTTALPRIALKLNSVELDLVGVTAEPSGSHSWTQREPEPDSTSSHLISSVGESSEPVLQSNSAGLLDGGTAHENDVWNSSSSDNVQQSLSSENRTGRAVSSVGGTTASEIRPRSHRKDAENEESDDRLSPQKKKSGPTAVGFLQSVKEKLSRGGKRVKMSRQLDKEEQHRSSSADGEKESSDDILAKYRRPTPKVNSQEISSGGGDLVVSSTSIKAKDEDKNEIPAYDPANLETCLAFQDTKKKLRRVLSQADPSLLNWPCRQPGDRKDSELMAFLQLQLAEAINLKDRDFVAQLHEAIRCLRQFDALEVRRLVRALKEEYKSRSVYISYLVRCRQGLLGTRAHLEKLRQRVERDKVLCTKHFLSVYARLFLEKKERAVTRFVADFQKLTVADEKTDLVERFLADLYLQLERDAMWQFASQQQLDEAKLYIERILMGHIYTHALYPNGDGDQMRDLILFEHLQKLSQVVTPDHKDLRIPKVYHYECPWPAAQADIALINAYKTPQDKLHCVLRCSATIMNLLSLAAERSVPAADDFMPVLLYVIIKANPPGLLSTVQYVTSFYGKRMQGEEQYWWLQFTSAIEFLKTMDYES